MKQKETLTIVMVGKPHNSQRKEECMKLASKLAMPMKKKKMMGAKEAMMDENEDSEMSNLYGDEEESDDMSEEADMEEEPSMDLSQASDDELLAELKKRKLKM